MAKEKTVATVSFWQDLFHVGVYKRNQGRVVRQVTFAALAVALFLGSWRLWDELRAMELGWAEFAVPGLILLIGGWVSFRLVNYVRFADFLIAVEAEMSKVSWPSRTELIRASLVVILLMFALAIILFGFDIFWQFLFKAMGVLHSQPASTP